jgi:F0F1-type ATP synthase membrane subunit b/b'
MSNSTDAIILWGHEFRRNKNGLDEEQVVAFVNGVTAERDLLKKYQEHLISLSKLAEKAVEQADEYARQALRDATEKANAEAETILARAQEQGKQIIEEKKAEALVQARSAAEAMKADARKQSDLILNEEKRRIRTEFKELANSFYRNLGAQLDCLTQKLDGPGEGFRQELALIAEPAAAPPLENNRTRSETAVTAADVVPEWELQVLPPLDIMQTLQIVTSLDELPEVRCTELIPQVDQVLITVYLKKPLSLVDVLRTMPQVGEVREEATNGNGNGHGKKAHRLYLTLARKVVA